MNERKVDSNFDDESHDSKYFDLIHQLLIDNRDRYDFQASQILESKSIIVELQGAKLEFKLTLQGCSYSTLDSNSRSTSGGWVRMGWGKPSKRKALPGFFARAEASSILNEE